MEHWLISFRCQSSERAQLWDTLRNEVLTNNLCTTSTFNIDQQFKSGSLDSLVALADDLTKLDHQLESTIRKIERQYLDLEPNPKLTISISNRGNSQDLAPSTYLSDFHWDISKYPPSKSLSEIASMIDERLKKLDEDIKKENTEYIEMRNSVSQITKRESGGLLNRDLNDILVPGICNAEDFFNTEYLKTLLVIVPKKEIDQWLATYELLSTRVVPQSTKQFNIEEKDGNTLWRVVILKIGESEFLVNTKKNRWAVREFEFNPQKNVEEKKMNDTQKTNFKNKQKVLIELCKSIFSELFIALTHLKAIRIYTESILRYSLPPQYFSIIVTPKDGQQKRIMTGLVSRFLKPGEKANMYCSKEESEDGEDFFPFVFLRMPKY